MTPYRVSVAQCGKVGLALIHLAAQFQVEMGVSRLVDQDERPWGTRLATIFGEAPEEQVMLYLPDHLPGKVALLDLEGCPQDFRDRVVAAFKEAAATEVWDFFVELER